MTRAPQSSTVGAFFFLSTRETRAAARLTCGSNLVKRKRPAKGLIDIAFRYFDRRCHRRDSEGYGTGYAAVPLQRSVKFSPRPQE